MGNLINKEYFKPKQMLAIEIRANNFTIKTKELAEQVGVCPDTIRKWFRKPAIMEACIKRHKQFDDEKAHILMEALFREGSLGNTNACDKWFDVKGYKDKTLTIINKVQAPFDAHLNRKNLDVKDAEIVEDEININNIPLPPRDIKNDDPKKVIRSENKRIKESYKTKQLNSDQMERHFWRKRAKAVNINMLPPGRPSKETLRKWQESIVEAEKVFANGILPNKQEGPK